METRSNGATEKNKKCCKPGLKGTLRHLILWLRTWIWQRLLRCSVAPCFNSLYEGGSGTGTWGASPLGSGAVLPDLLLFQ